MNYSENINMIRNSLLESNYDAQYYQNSKKATTDKRPQQTQKDNNSVTMLQPSQTSDNRSRLNYYSVPFTPKLQGQGIVQDKNMIPDTSTDSINQSNRIPSSNQDTNYYKQGHNINFDGYGGIVSNQCMYNPMDFMPYLYQLPNNATTSNYWPVGPNNSYYGLSNSALPLNIEPNQMGNNSDNSFSAKPNFNSADIHSGNQQFVQNQPTMKQNNRGYLCPDASDKGALWNQNLSDSTINQFGNINLNDQDFSAHFANDAANNHTSFDQAEYDDIIDSVTNPKTKKILSEILKTINPKTIRLVGLTNAKFFVIKSYSEDDLHRAIKYGVWCSTLVGNQILDDAYKELTEPSPNADVGRLFLLFSVNGSGFFAGIAEMMSPVDFKKPCGFWTQKKWIGKFDIRWHYVKDVRNNSLRHIRSQANDNKPVTNSRDVTEVTPLENGLEFIKVFHHAKQETSVFDDFEHYEQREMCPDLQ